MCSPLYVVDCQLPGEVTACLGGAGTGQDKEVIVPGLGRTSQLDPPGPPEQKFSLSFKLGPELPASAPPLSLSWGIIDQVYQSLYSCIMNFTAVSAGAG